MAIDPGIVGQLNIPQFKPVDPLATMAQLENLKGLQEQRQALAEERQQQTQALIQKAKDTAAINAALQDSNGDLLGAGDSLTKAGMGTLGQTLYDADAKKRKGIADAVDAEGKASSAQLDMATKIIGTMGDSPQHYQAGYTALGGLITDPKVRQALGQMLPQNPDPSEISGIVDRLGNLSLSMKDRLDRRDKYVQGFLKGEYQPNLAGELAETPMDQRGDTLKAALALVPDYQTRQALQQTFEPLLGATPEVLNQFALTPEQRQKSAEEKARADAEAAKATSKPVLLDGKPAEVRFNQKGQPIDDAGNVIPSARVKPIPPAAAVSIGLDASGQPPDAVKQYADDLVKGNITIMGVPAGGGMRNAVETYMRAQHFDMNRPLTAQVEARVEFAQAQMPQIDAVEKMAKEIDRQGLMGTFAGRFRDLAAKESTPAAIGGLTADQRKLIGDFMSSSEFLSSGVAMTHFGARASGDAVNMMREQLDPKGKDLETYLGNLTSARRIMEGYAALKPGGAKPPAGSSSTSSAPVAGVYNPATKKIEPVKKGGG